MAAIKITVEGIGGLELGSREDYNDFLESEGVKCLLKNGIRQGYDRLSDGGTYTLGPPRQNPATTRTQIDIGALVAKELTDWDTSTEIRLQPFEVSVNAAFHQYWNKNSLPSVPTLGSTSPRPSILLHGLEDENNEKVHKGTPGYEYIESSQSVAPIALYGTSGAGKTRTILEYLSHNYGFYLSAGADNLHNPGSLDLQHLLNTCHNLRRVEVHHSEDDAAQKKQRKNQSEANLDVVHDGLKILLDVRKAVFNHVNAALASTRNGLSSYEWLLLQLFPAYFLGKDVFRDVLNSIFDIGGMQSKCMPVVIENTKMSCFLDECQVLVEELDDRFLSSSGDESRSAFNAFLKGLSRIAISGVVHFPCFSGTGMSFESYKNESMSLLNKPGLTNHKFFFCQLKVMTPDDVLEYMSKFLNMNGVGNDLKTHVGRWLAGRPRWAASFIEKYLEQPLATSDSVPRGQFKDLEIPLIKSLNRYIDIATLRHKDVTRLSWDMEDKSPYKCVEKIFEKKGKSWFDVQDEFRQVTFEYALSGSAQVVEEHASAMIKAGIASVEVVCDGGEFVKARIDEPLVVQASLNVFGLQEITERKLASMASESLKGDVFEQFLLPAIQSQRFRDVMKMQLGANFLEDYEVLVWSSYGVLATRCDGSGDTFAWMEGTLNCRFEGQFPPFCFPDTLFGPDVAFLMRKVNSWKTFRLVVIQAKLRMKLNQADALRSLVPEFFYHQNRGTNPVSSLNDEATKKKWSTIENELLGMVEAEEGEERKVRPMRQAKVPRTTSTKPKPQSGKRKRTLGVVRVEVQYPAETTSSAEFGEVAPRQFCKKRNTFQSPNDLRDHLMTVSKDNANALFGEKGVRLLQLVKPTKR